MWGFGREYLRAGRWTECSPICFPGQLCKPAEEMIFAKDIACTLVFYLAKPFFHANERINEANIFLYETTFPQELKNWHVFIANINLATGRLVFIRSR